MISVGALVGKIRSMVRELLYLRATHAPRDVVLGYFRSVLADKKRIRPYAALQREFSNYYETLELSTDWFTAHIPYWGWSC